ncbi:MAG: OmpA family protein [Bacteroidota bacterium]
MIFKKVIFCLIFLLINVGLFAQASPNDLLKKANDLYENTAYREALQLYLEYQKVDPKDLVVKMRIGVCYFESGSADLAKEYLEFVANDKKPLTNAYFYLAKTYHYLHQFEDAAVYYKRYLAYMKEDDTERERIKESILRCMAGRQIIWQPELAVVENLGNKINTIGDETAPVIDPFELNTLYFSANRPVIGSDSATANADIYVSRVARGTWSAGASIGPDYNSENNDQLQGFSEDGYQVVVTRDAPVDANDIFVQMFFAPDEVDPAPYRLPSPINSQAWDGDAQFFRDSIVIFSSNRSGGYGGMDLYATVRIGGQWSYPENLGPTVNSPFDEVNPFLGADGRTVYYSSDNLSSMGGYDIFKTTFVDSIMTWTAPENLGYPVNSGANDHYFRLGEDGVKAFFSSDRSGGEGGSDLYVAYFQSPQDAMASVSDPVVYLLVRPVFLTEIGNPDLDTPATSVDTAVVADATDTPDAPPAFREKLEIGPFFYAQKEFQLPPTTVTALDELASYLEENENVAIEFVAHSNDNDQSINSLFFSLKRAERLANHLIQKGIASNRIMVQSYGDQFPIAEERGGESEPIAESLNRRVDIRFRNMEFADFKVDYQVPLVSSLMASDRADQLNEKLEGLHYRVQLLAATRRFEDPIMASGPVAYIERSMDNDYMKYCLGILSDYTTADALRNTIQASGYPDAYVVPYVNGIRLSREEAIDYSAEFPDLNRFLTATGRASLRKEKQKVETTDNEDPDGQ